METGGREEILLERETMRLIVFFESVATILINPSLKRDTICRRWLVFILTQKIIAPRRFRKDKRSQENMLISQTMGNGEGHNLMYKEKLLPWI
jgi:hypothetical protein